MVRRFSFSRFLMLCVFLSLVITQTSMAQGSASIKGTVFDKMTGEGLTGANIIVRGTNNGTATDLDGGFVVRNVPSGRQTFIISYIGYISDSVSVNIPQSGIVEQDFGLNSTIIEGQVVVVTAQAQGQLQAINQQLSSDKIANIVSEARIQELPDFNAAQAISRLPGVATLESSGEANKVVIRGLAPQFNQVAVSGISLASTGSTRIGAASQDLTNSSTNSVNNDRSVDLSMISPYMIKTISVFKSLTPDLNANAIGGVVNMELREAPSGLRGDILWQSGYTDKSKTYGNYRGVVSISNRFFDDAIGVYALGNAEQYDRDADNMNATYTTGYADLNPATGYRKVQVTDVQLNRHLETRKRVGGNLILDYKFLTGTLRSTNMFSRLNSDFKDYTEVINYKNNLIDFRYRAGKNTTDVGVNSLDFKNDFDFMSMELQAAYTYSENTLPESPFYQIRQTGGATIGSVPTDTRPEVLASQVKFDNSLSKTPLTTVSLYSTKYKENGRVLKGDFKVPVNLEGLFSGSIKFGGMYRHNTHTNDQSTPFFEPEGATTASGSTTSFKKQIMLAIQERFPITIDGNTGRFLASNFSSSNTDLLDTFLDDNFGKMYWAIDPTILNEVVNYVRNTPAFSGDSSSAQDPGGWYLGYYQTLPNDYTYIEKYSAAYLMTELKIGSDLTVVGGVRYENVNSAFQAFNLLDGRDVRTQSFKSITVNPENHFYLPQVQAKYNVAEWADIRYAYTQTLARPDYSQLSPHYNLSYDRNFVWSGNSKLKPAQAYNHDLMFTFHSNELGLLSIGGFYKEIKNFSFATQYKLRARPLPGLDSIGTYNGLGSPPKDGATVYTFMNNPKMAFVKGIEIDFQTRFWYLPFPLDGLLLGINYTFIKSETSYPLRDEVTYGIPGRPNYRLVQIDSTRQGRLINQPNNIANIFVGYDYKGFSAKLSFVFQGNSVSGIGGYPEQDGFTDDYFRVDVSVRQILPWTGFQLFLDVNNLNNRMNVAAQQSIGGFTQQKNYGLTLNLGVRYAYSPF